MVNAYPYPYDHAGAIRVGLARPPAASLLEIEVDEAGHVLLLTTFAII